MVEASDVELGGLQATLEHARSALPYYHELFADHRGPVALEDFPVLDAGVVCEWPDRFYHLDRFPDFILTTGGTSARRPGYFPFEYAEMELAFRAKLGGWEGSSLAPEGFPGLVLNLVDLQHGLVPPIGHGQPVVSLPLEVGRHLRLVVRFLRDGLLVRGRRYPVLQLIGAATKLRALTAYCEAEGFSGSEFEVQRITTAAFHTSGAWERRMREHWQADVATAYGLTEFAEATAVECGACGGFHLPEIVHVEYLPVDSIGHVEGGAYRLVLTALLPYRRTMPLIRYDTGDLVEPLPPCRLAGAPGFRLHGRRGAVLLSDDGKVLLTPLDVLDAIDDIDEWRPGVVRRDDAVPLVMSWGSGHTPKAFRQAGYPAVNCTVVEGARPALRLSVELEAGAVGAGEIAARLADRLLARQAERTRAAPDGSTLHVECLAAGGLAERDLPLTLI